MHTVGPNFTTIIMEIIMHPLKKEASPISLSFKIRWIRDLRNTVESTKMGTLIAQLATVAWPMQTSTNWLEALLSVRQLSTWTKDRVQVQVLRSQESWPGMHRLRVANSSYCSNSSSSSNSSNSSNSSTYSEDSNSQKERRPSSRWSYPRAVRNVASPGWT